MPLMTIFYIVVGVALLLIMYVLYLMGHQEPQVESMVQKIDPEEVSELTEKLSVDGSGLEEVGVPEKKKGFFGGKARNESKDTKPLGVIDPEVPAADDLEIPARLKSGGFWAKLTAKIGKNKENPLDDIPRAHTFA